MDNCEFHHGRNTEPQLRANNACRYIEDIQVFGVNMSFISLSEVKNFIFHECRRHE